MIHIRNSVIVMLCVTVICMAFGFIVLSVHCKNEADKIDSFDVSFSDVRKTSSVRGTDLEPYGNIDITNSGLELDMSFVLNGGNDELSYIATIKNNGTLPAEIVDQLDISHIQTFYLYQLLFLILKVKLYLQGMM